MAAFWDENKPDTGPPPRISQSKVLAIGFGIFALAKIWPPLILVLALFLSQFLPYSLRVNDDPESRRLFYREFQKRENRSIPKEWRKTPDDIVIKERYRVNERGMCLMTTRLEPSDRSKIKAVACFCHGYGDNGFAYLKRVEFFRYVRAGIAVVNMEIEGHGRSDGKLGLIPCFDTVVDDCYSFFQDTMRFNYPGKKAFLVGESMGGAIAIKTYIRNPNFFSGVVFIAPLCKVSEHMLPPDWVVSFLKLLLGKTDRVTWIGEQPLAPTKGDTAALSFKIPEKRRLFTMHPFVYGRQPRFHTAREIIDLTADISNNLAKRFDGPFLVQHGTADKVTCPKLSQMLYDESPSKDKEMKLYEGMFHNLLGGEPKENTDLILNDSMQWILSRS